MYRCVWDASAGRVVARDRGRASACGESGHILIFNAASLRAVRLGRRPHHGAAGWLRVEWWSREAGSSCRSPDGSALLVVDEVAVSW